MSNAKKYTNLSLAASVALASLPNTLTAGVLDHAMSNLTMPNVYEETDSEGNVISTNFYSGGLSYSFENSYPPPIFSASPPSIEAGCNGLNIKGMFISLLGLDQLGAMLQNAGASLAWGVAIGLIYSLPGVASAFKMINKWAKDIQNLLGNACQSGINIGKALAKKAGIDKEAIEQKINSTIEDLAGCKQEGENCVVHALGLDEFFDDKGVFSFGGSNEEMSDKDKVDALTVMFRGIYESDMSLGGNLFQNLIKKDPTLDLAQTLLSAVPSTSASTMKSELYGFEKGEFMLDIGEGKTTTNGILKIGIKDIANKFASESEKTRIELELWSYILLYNFAGDLIISNPMSVVNSSLQKYIATKDATDKKKALKELESLSKSGVSSIHLQTPNGLMNDQTAGTALANFLLYGKKALRSGGGTIKLMSPKFMVVKATEEKDTKAGLLVLAQGASSPGAANANNMINVDNFEGIAKASSCVIKAKVRALDNYTSLPGCEETPEIPVTIGGIDKFIKVIQNSPIVERYRLEDALIEYNSQKAALGLLYSMQTALDEATGFNKEFLVHESTEYRESNAHGAVPESLKAAAKMEAEYAKRVAGMIAFAKAEIQDKTGGFTGYKDIESIFKAQEAKNRARGMRNAN